MIVANKEYLDSLIRDKVEESLNLDYKAAASLARDDKKTNEIAKDVSSFANSDGGKIIYGINEDSDNKHLPASIDPVDRSQISKEWLEQIIQSKIRPKIDGVIIHPIEVDNDVNKVVYVVEIPQSSTAHQANDKRYYRRSNFLSTPMYDYEIKDILNRLKTPIINLEFEVVKRKLDTKPLFQTAFKNPSQQGPRIENIYEYYLRVYARNKGKVFAKYVNCLISIPEKCIDDKHGSAKPNRKVEYFADNTVRDVLDVKIHLMNPKTSYGPSRYVPILPRMRKWLDSSIPKLHEYYSDYENEIEWVCYADNAEPQRGNIRFQDIKQVDEFEWLK